MKYEDLMKAKEEYLAENPFGLDVEALQNDAEAIAYFISYASGQIQY